MSFFANTQALSLYLAITVTLIIIYRIDIPQSFRKSKSAVS